MKFLKYFLLLVLVLILLSLMYVTMQSSSYDVKRSKIINEPITKIFNTVNDLKTWEKWGPWHDEDSTIVVSYGDKTIGVGANDRWTSKDGPGAMRTLEVVPNTFIKQELTFGDNEPSEILWDFKEVEEGTKVTWKMKDDKAPFVFKIFSAMNGGWDNMLGPMLVKGLDNLDKVVKKIPAKFRLSDVKTVDTQEQLFIGYQYQMKIDHNAMLKAFKEAMPKANAYAVKKGLEVGDYTPAALYHKWNEKTGETIFHIGLMLYKDIVEDKGMDKLKVVGGKYAMISKCGDYGEGDYEAHTAIGSYLLANNCKTKFPLYELYVNESSAVKPEDIQTDIYYLAE